MTRHLPLSMLVMFWKAGDEGSCRMVPVKLEEERCCSRQWRGELKDAVEGWQARASSSAITAGRIDTSGCKRLPSAAIERLL